jgi:hypothetical protein
LLVGREAHCIGGRDVAVEAVVDDVGGQSELALTDQFAALLIDDFGGSENVALAGDLTLNVFDGGAVQGQRTLGGDFAAAIV